MSALDFSPSPTPRVLLLGGTREASLIAQMLAAQGTDAIFSYAGVTHAPLAQPLPVRVGGFGGVQGLVHYMQHESITHLIDATHPFAARISDNARAACAAVGAVALLRVERPAWQPRSNECWTQVPDMEAAARSLPQAPTRVFAAIGRKQLAALAQHAAQHHYLLRWVDVQDVDENTLKNIGLPNAHIVPLPLRAASHTVQDEIALLRQHRVQWLISKNAGGAAARLKLDAAHALGIQVVMVQRPTPSVAPPARFAHITQPAEALAWLASA